MLSLFLMIRRLVHALVGALKDEDFRNVAVLVLILMFSGTIFYWSVEGWSFLDSFYFCVMTLATVGYGDLAPQTALGKIFTIVYLFVGLGLFVSFVRFLGISLANHRNNARKDD